MLMLLSGLLRAPAGRREYSTSISSKQHSLEVSWESRPVWGGRGFVGHMMGYDQRKYDTRHEILLTVPFFALSNAKNNNKKHAESAMQKSTLSQYSVTRVVFQRR